MASAGTVSVAVSVVATGPLERDRPCVTLLSDREPNLCCRKHAGRKGQGNSMTHNAVQILRCSNIFGHTSIM